MTTIQPDGKIISSATLDFMTTPRVYYISSVNYDIQEMIFVEMGDIEIVAIDPGVGLRECFSHKLLGDRIFFFMYRCNEQESRIKI